MNLARSRLLLPRSLRYSSPLSYHYSCSSSSRRLLSTTPVAAPDGYTASNDEVARLATNPLKPLTLRDLVRFGRPPLSPQALLASARFTREFLPIRLCRRIVALRNLPFIIVSNPHVSSIYDNYQQSLRTVQSFPISHPNTLAEEVAFTEMLIGIVKTHANTIPTLARGFLECRRYISPAEATKFLDHHLRARIGTRLMAEQHIALHLASTTSSVTNNSPIDYDGSSDTYIGTIDTALQPAHIIESCASFVGDICELRYGVRPQLRIDGDPEVRFPYIPVHLEYIITELLKNAFRATVEAGSTVPIIVTIAAAPESAGITIRIRDQGGGIAPEDIGQIWSYSFSTFDHERSVAGGGSGGGARDPAGDDALGRFNEVVGAPEGSSIAGLGYGLPLSRAYAEYFGGSLKVQSAFGWGTDVYLKLKGVGIGDFGGPGMEGLSGHHDDI